MKDLNAPAQQRPGPSGRSFDVAFASNLFLPPADLLPSFPASASASQSEASRMPTNNVDHAHQKEGAKVDVMYAYISYSLEEYKGCNAIMQYW